MAFESFAVETLEATWGSHRKLSLFVWRVPLDAAVRELLARPTSRPSAALSDSSPRSTAATPGSSSLRSTHRSPASPKSC
eukprot:6170656-Prymnesium_polylepis.1